MRVSISVLGLLHPGDLLVEVDGKPVVGLEPEQVIQILVGMPESIVAMFVMRNMLPNFLLLQPFPVCLQLFV